MAARSDEPFSSVDIDRRARTVAARGTEPVAPPPKRYPPDSLALGAQGEDWIKQWEGLPGTGRPALTPYTDATGNLTIAWGHRLSRPTEFPSPIDEAQAQDIFDADRKRHEDQVRKVVKVPLTPKEFEALVMLHYNVPKALSPAENGGKGTLLLQHLNAGDYEGAARHFADWNKGHVKGELKVLDGLTRRRAAEATVFRGGPYRGP